MELVGLEGRFARSWLVLRRAGEKRRSSARQDADAQVEEPRMDTNPHKDECWLMNMGDSFAGLATLRDLRKDAAG